MRYSNRILKINEALSLRLGKFCKNVFKLTDVDVLERWISNKEDHKAEIAAFYNLPSVYVRDDPVTGFPICCIARWTDRM